jgi:hypothetical protein
MADEPDTRDTDEKAGVPTDADVADHVEQHEVDAAGDFDETDKDESQSEGRLASGRRRVARR